MHKMNIADRCRDSEWAMNELGKAYYSTVSVNGDDGFPYSIPMCVFRVGDDLCFHTAMKGRLNTLLLQNDKVCVTAVTNSTPDPENTTVRYRSAMAFGNAALVEDKAEKMKIMKHFFDKYLPGNPKEEYYIDRVATIAAVWHIKIKDSIGKESLPGHNV